MSHSDGRFPGATATGTILIIDPKKLWPVMAARGALAILFGIFALIWPGITVLALALLFGVWALLDGISLLINAFRHGRAHADWRDWVPSLLAGLLGIAAAVVTVLMRDHGGGTHYRGRRLAHRCWRRRDRSGGPAPKADPWRGPHGPRRARRRHRRCLVVALARVGRSRAHHHARRLRLGFRHPAAGLGMAVAQPCPV
jgi:hypothetical protein